jgi:hypothetical protein
MVVTRRQAGAAKASPAKLPAKATLDPFTSYRSRESSSSSSESSDDEDSSTWGVPIWVQKKLLQLIESQGGLRLTSVKHLCESDPDSFGEKGSARRRQIQNLVNRFKNWKDSKYYAYLDSLDVEAHSQLLRQAKAPPSRHPVSIPECRLTPRYPSSTSSLRSPHTPQEPPSLPLPPSLPQPAVPWPSTSSTMTHPRPTQFATAIDHDPSMDSEVRARVKGTFRRSSQHETNIVAPTDLDSHPLYGHSWPIP